MMGHAVQQWERVLKWPGEEASQQPKLLRAPGCSPLRLREHEAATVRRQSAHTQQNGQIELAAVQLAVSVTRTHLGRARTHAPLRRHPCVGREQKCQRGGAIWQFCSRFPTYSFLHSILQSCLFPTGASNATSAQRGNEPSEPKRRRRRRLLACKTTFSSSSFSSPLSPARAEREA